MLTAELLTAEMLNAELLKNMRDFRKYKVWEKAHELVLELYNLKLPKEELYGLFSQIRRAGISIPTNIAEGCGRGSDADFKRFLQMAFGSASEIEYLIILCRDLKYINNEQYAVLHFKTEEVKKMLASLIVRLR